MKNFVALLCCIVGLGGCVADRQKIIATSDDFLIVEAGSQDDYASLAKQYTGSSRNSSVVERYNPGLKVKAGSKIAIPRKNPNPAGVFVDGYQRIPILCYHQFTDRVSGRNSMVVTRAAFESQMAYLKENDFQVIALKDIRSFLEGESALPDKSVVITVDDGYKSFLSIAYPVLKKHGFASTLFVYPDFIGAGLALRWNEVNTLSRDPLVDIQSHSKSHSSLSPYPEGEKREKYSARLKVEVEETDRILNRKTGHTAQYFAYPYGNSSKELVELLKQHEYQLGLTVNKGGNASFAAPFLMRRTMVYGGDDLKTFKKNLDVFQKVNLK